jgi:hypothetical protein
VTRYRPAPEQALFRFVWHDEADDRADDDGAPEIPTFSNISPPLRDRVRGRHGPAAVELWGVPVKVGKAPTGPVERPVRRRLGP